MRYILSLCLMLTITSWLFAAKVDTLLINSPSMKKNTKACIVTPEGYDKAGTGLPVLYLLHGYGGNYQTFVNNFPYITEAADHYGMLLVCPDGGVSGWYMDSPVDSSMKYETYVTKELVPFIDSSYSTIRNREGRAIMGLSMGGHGALYLSIRHPEMFGAAGSMSGCLDLRPVFTNWDLEKRLGSIDKFPENWENNSVINMLNQIKNGTLSIIIDCGVDDIFIDVNRQIHMKLISLNIGHDYIERPGGHTREYWSTALPYQLLFFHNYFN
ncbi:MAG TPA: alpha/beta hydrolase-fold protein, partial [Bacteroidales bacterium]|nr:alpha/beta hydrolase-fold protein [Bacteroidales bacterium]